VTLRADKRCALLSLIDFVIENATIVECRSNVATFSAATRFDRYFSRLITRGVHRGHVVTLRALQIRMGLVAKGAG
jgi:hypothetical protein